MVQDRPANVVEAASAKADAEKAGAVALEHRLSQLEAQIAIGLDRMAAEMRAEMRTQTIEITGMKEQLRKQNGRVTNLETWAAKVREATAMARGIAEGRTSVGKGQLAIIAVCGPLLFAGIDIAIKVWG